MRPSDTSSPSANRLSRCSDTSCATTRSLPSLEGSARRYDRHARQQQAPAAVVEVEVGQHHQVDLIQGTAGSGQRADEVIAASRPLAHQRPRAGVDQHRRRRPAQQQHRAGYVHGAGQLPFRCEQGGLHRQPANR